jgi:hypothetical protein
MREKINHYNQIIFSHRLPKEKESLSPKTIKKIKTDDE